MSAKSDAFITKYRPIAEKVSKETGIPVARILAQAGFESGWNTNPPGNNLFGVKAQPGYEGPSQTLDTKEADASGNLVGTKQPFRTYANPEESFRDAAKVLQQDNFKAALNPNLNDAQYATTLQTGGYGTDPNYAAKLHGAINVAREGLGQAPDGSVVTLASQPSRNIGTGPQGVMQAGGLPDTTPGTGMMAGVTGFDASDPGAYANRTTNGADMGGYGGSPKIPDAPTNYGQNALLGMGMGMMAAGQPRGGGPQPLSPTPMLQAYKPEGQIDLPSLLFKRKLGFLS